MNFTVFIGRFQPFHPGHYKVVQKALEVSDYLFIILGSAESPRDVQNPFTVTERIAMIRAALSLEEQKRVMFSSVRDYPYNDTKWQVAVQHSVDNCVHTVAPGWTDKPHHIDLIGHKKDDSSYYLEKFPQWGSIDVPNDTLLNATDARIEYFVHGLLDETKYTINDKHAVVLRRLFAKVKDEIQSQIDDRRDYIDEWGPGPHLTVDALVEQSGHVLLIKRGENPGKDKWALPGGFLNKNERFDDAVIRELKEETCLKVPYPVLRASIDSKVVYDDPYRDPRARIISQVYHFKLNPQIKLPRIKPSDDAKHAEWVPITELIKYKDNFFADHFDILSETLNI